MMKKYERDINIRQNEGEYKKTKINKQKINEKIKV